MESVKSVKKINKLCVFITLAVISMIFTACGSNTASDSLKIVTTLFPQYDFAKQVTDSNSNTDITLLLTPGSESHSYEPTPKDISKIQQADIFIYIGGESEVWVDEILKSVGSDKLKVVRLMDYITPTEVESEDEHGHEYEHTVDEHIFTSLKNSEILLNEISNAICEVDKGNEKLYKNNTETYAKKIAELDEQFTEMISNAQRKTVVFGDRFPFVYFASDYGLDYHAAFSGCSSESEASSATMSSLIDIVKNENIPSVFYIEFSPQTIANKISDATGVETELLHSCHNISKDDLKNGVSYVDLMTQNYEKLSEALN